jgi:5'-3' exonuclease
MKPFKMMIIDCDPFIYKCGFALEHYNEEMDMLEVEPVHHGYHNIDAMLNRILEQAPHELWIGYLTSNKEPNFRMVIFPEYKANRKDMKRPVYYAELRQYLIENYAFITYTTGQEADDACSIKQYLHNPEGYDPDAYTSIVCSIDKDFDNIPGWHLNYDQERTYYVDPIQAKRNFYLQILTGDSADNIPRIEKGWRKKEAEGKIAAAKTEKEMIDIVKKEIYNVLYKGKESAPKLTVEQEMIWRGQLVHLRTYEGELWTIPTE